jgi:hypothetical protein
LFFFKKKIVGNLYLFNQNSVYVLEESELIFARAKRLSPKPVHQLKIPSGFSIGSSMLLKRQHLCAPTTSNDGKTPSETISGESTSVDRSSTTETISSTTTTGINNTPKDTSQRVGSPPSDDIKSPPTNESGKTTLNCFFSL